MFSFGAAMKILTRGLRPRAGSSEAVPTADRADGHGQGASLWRRRWLFCGLSAIAVQLGALVAFSTLQYHRYALTRDFGAYSQAWWAIAHGHLNPYDTLFGAPFWQNNAEFLMWPLALLYFPARSPLTLLVVQDLTVAVTEAIALCWALDVVSERFVRDDRVDDQAHANGIMGVALAAMLLDPWLYETTGFDVHFEPFTALFCVLMGRSLWLRQFRWLWLWVPLALSTNVFGGLCVAALGLSAILAKRSVRTGSALVAAGLAWFFFVIALHGAGVGGTVISTGYRYLTGGNSSNPFAIGVGLFTHPTAVWHLLSDRWVTALAFVVVFGFVGVASRWALPIVAVVFLPSMLNSSGIFFRLLASFQVWPALPFVLLGTVMLASSWLDRGGRGKVPERAGVVLLGSWLAVTIALAIPLLPSVWRTWIAVSPQASAVLARDAVRIPANSELIASQGVVGRFGDRTHVYPIMQPGRTYPLTGRPVYLLFAKDQGTGELTAAATQVEISFVQNRLRATPLDSGSGIFLFEWNPASGRQSLLLP
ncbi:MAG TPA: DUF2079 domain-containing protein [Acidimicrobiales bacterium]|nr:DUF2079 domain-containing protein [Acidimicrobiales bacterium]